MRTETLVSLLGIAVHTAIDVNADTNSNRVMVVLQSSGTIVKGLPGFVAVEVRNEGSRAVKFPECGPVHTQPYMLKVKSADGQVFSRSVRGVSRSFVLRIHGGGLDGQNPIFVPEWTLAPSESRRFLINAGGCLPYLEGPASRKFVLEDRAYTLTLGIYESVRHVALSKFLAVSDAMEFRIVDPVGEELKALTNRTGLAIAGAAFGMRSAPTPQECEALEPKELRETVALSALLYNIRTAKDIATVSVAEYRTFIGEWLRPEIEQVEFDILLAKGEKDKAAVAKAAILERFPAMRFWVEGAERGAGLCATIRTGSRR